MPYISKQIVRELIETLDVCGVGAHHPDLLALLEQSEDEPVATVLNRGEKMLRVGVLNAEGMGLTDGTKLYTHPPAPRKITAEDVTDDMVLTCFRHFPEIIGNRGAIDTAKPHIVDAVNAYLTLEKL